MPITKKINKKFIGGAVAGVSAEQQDINIFCVKLFKHYLRNNLLNKQLNNTPSNNKKIFIGFNKSNTYIFGNNDIPIADTITIDQALFIDDIPINRTYVNQFKLYIMSIMADYPIQKDGKNTNIYKEITTLLNPLKIQDIMELLGIDALPAPAPPAALPPAPPAALPPAPPPVSKVNDDDMLELYIYREFGIKCILNGECFKLIDSKFYTNNPNITRNSLNESPFRDLYVNMFEYITGSEGSLISKEKGLLSCVDKIDIALKNFKKILINVHVFKGPRTNHEFNVIKLIIRINIIRKEVNSSVGITGQHHINESIF